MKKLLILAVFIMALCVSSITLNAETLKGVKEVPTHKIIVDGKMLKTGSTPINYNGRVLVGLRDILTALGVQNDPEHIIWNQENKTIKIIKDSTEINLSIGDKKAIVNGSEISIDAEPIIYKNSTYIPARFVAQSLSKLVLWDGETNSIIVYSEDMYNQVKSIAGSGSSSPKSFEVSEETYIEGGKTIYSEKSETTSDADKNLSYTTSTIDVDGCIDMLECFEDEKYTYKRHDFTEKWLKTLKSESDSSSGTNNSNQEDSKDALYAGMVVTEKDSDKIIIEGENLYYAIRMTKGTKIDVLRDKTSKCSAKIECNASNNELRQISINITGTLDKNNTKKPYELTRVYKITYGDEVASVVVPDDLKNSYSIPKGYDEFYSIKAFSLVVPKSWQMPNYIDESPCVYYANPNDPKKWCGIMPSTIYMGFGREILPISTIRDKLVNEMKPSLSKAKVIKNEKFKWKNMNTVRTTLSGIDATTKKATKIQITVAEYLNTAVVFIYMGEEKTFNEKSAEAQKIIDSWESRAKG